LATDNVCFYQAIEADMVSDFAWGGANAQPVTLSFWAWGAAGTYGGSLCNAAGTRSYPFSFVLPTTGVWTKLIIHIPGDTAGTWVMAGNAASFLVRFDLGSGANYRGPANAWVAGNIVGVTGSLNVANSGTLYLTGVKLEVGSVATPFNRQSLAKRMADCQRYYQTGNVGILVSNAAAGNAVGSTALFPVVMRAAPTIAFGALTVNVNVTPPANSNNISVSDFRYWFNTTAAGAAQGSAPFTASAEL
jgi:hypothetical protein